MGRNTRRVCRDGGLRPKRDTPVKRALGGRERLRRLLPAKVPDALQEEPEAADRRVPAATTATPQTKNIQPVHCKSVLCLSRPAFSEHPRDAAVLPATPANKTSSYQVSQAGLPAIQLMPKPETFKREIVVKDGERNSQPQEKPSLSLTSESTISSSNSDTFNSEDDDDDDEDCFFLASSSSSSIPSPEIFRGQSNAEMEILAFKAEHLDLHPNIRNSTLLDESRAQSVHMYQPLNLSAIIDASTILAEKHDISGPEAETQIKADSFKSDEKINCKTSAQLTRKRPILCKKKVIFKSPIISDIFEIKHSRAAKCSVHHAIDLVQTSSSGEHRKLGEEASRAGDVTCKDHTLLMRATLKRPVTSSPEKAKFFDFVNDDDEDAFFQMMRERSIKLRGGFLFPLSADKHTFASALRHSKPKHLV